MVGYTPQSYQLPSAKNNQYLAPAINLEKKILEPTDEKEITLPEHLSKELGLPALMPEEEYYLDDHIPRQMVELIKAIYPDIFYIRDGRIATVDLNSVSANIHHIIGKKYLRVLKGLKQNQWGEVTYSDLLVEIDTLYRSAPNDIRSMISRGHRLLNLIPLPISFHKKEVHREQNENDYERSITLNIRNHEGENERYVIENYPQLFLAMNIFSIASTNVRVNLISQYESKIRESKTANYRNKFARNRAKENEAMYEFMIKEIRIICKIADKLRRYHPELYRIWELTFVKQYAEA